MIECELIPFVSDKIGKQYYQEYTRSTRWRAIRQYHLSKKENKKCTCCNSTNSLEVHHRSYQNLGGLGETKDLITLCKSCHTQLHKDQRKRKMSVESATRSFLDRYKFTNDSKSKKKKRGRKGQFISKWNFDRKMMQRKRILDEEYKRKYGEEP